MRLGEEVAEEVFDAQIDFVAVGPRVGERVGLGEQGLDGIVAVRQVARVLEGVAA